MQMELHKRTFPIWILALSLVALFALVGCGGGDQEVETDPTQTEGMGEGDLEDVQLEDDPFGSGESTDQGELGGEDLDAEQPEAVVLELTDVFFDFDSFDLDAEAREALARNARLLQNEPDVDIVIEGHCDERGTVQYNLALGEKRARETRRYLVSLGVPVDRMEIVSYGKERPFVEGTGEEVWSQNRRAHFVQEE